MNGALRYPFLDQKSQLPGRNGLGQIAKGRDLMGLYQLVDRLQYAFIFSAHQNERTGVSMLDQMPRELDSIHFRHIDIEQDQIGATVGMVDQLKRSASGVAGHHRGES